MAQRNYGFDPYRIWLGIPANRRPPTYYDILGIEAGESDDDVIRSAAEQRRSFVQSKRGGDHDEAIAKILHQINEAVATLLVPQVKFEYDRRIGLIGKRKSSRPTHPAPPWFQSIHNRIYGEGSGIISAVAGIMLVICLCFGAMFWLSSSLPMGKLGEHESGDSGQKNSQLADRSSQLMSTTVEPESPLVDSPQIPVPESLSNTVSREDDKPLIAIEQAAEEIEMIAVQSPQSTTSIVSEEETVVASDINELVGLDVQSQIIAGAWIKTGNVIVSDRSLPSIIEIPVDLPSEYDLTLKVNRLSGIDTFAIGLVSQGNQFVVSLGANTKAGRGSGIGNIDGRACFANESFRNGDIFANGSVQVVCRVRKELVAIDVDGKRLTQYTGNPKRLSLERGWPNVRPDRLFLGSWESEFRVESLSIVDKVDNNHEASRDLVQPTELLPGEEKDPVAIHMQDLQGTWKCVAADENGKPLDRSVVSSQARRVVIDGNSLTMERSGAKWTGKFEIDADSGSFDWIGKNADGVLTEWIGIYEVNGDRLKLNFIFQKNGWAKRPTDFKSLPPTKPGLAHANYSFVR